MATAATAVSHPAAGCPLRPCLLPYRVFRGETTARHEDGAINQRIPGPAERLERLRWAVQYVIHHNTARVAQCGRVAVSE